MVLGNNQKHFLPVQSKKNINNIRKFYLCAAQNLHGKASQKHLNPVKSYAALKTTLCTYFIVILGSH